MTMLIEPPSDKRAAPKKTWDRGPANKPVLDAEQAAAAEAYQERWRIQKEAQDALMEKNAARTTPAERGNVEQARKIKASYDVMRNN